MTTTTQPEATWTLDRDQYHTHAEIRAVEVEPGTWELASTIYSRIGGKPGPGTLRSPDFDSREEALAAIDEVAGKHYNKTGRRAR